MHRAMLFLMSVMLMCSSSAMADDTDRLPYLKLSTEKTKNPEKAAKAPLELDGDATVYAILEIKARSGHNSLIIYGLEHPNDGLEEYHGRNMSLRFLIDEKEEGFIQFSTEDIDYNKGDKWFSLQVLPGDEDAEVIYADSLINALLELKPGKHSVEVYTQDSEHVSFIIDTSSKRDVLEDGAYKVWAKRADSTKVPERDANPDIEKFMFASLKDHKVVSPFGVILNENKWFIEQNSLGVTESRSVGGYEVWQFKNAPRKCELYGPMLFRQFYIGGKFSDEMDTGILGTTGRMDIPCEKLEDTIYRGKAGGSSLPSASPAVSSTDSSNTNTGHGNLGGGTGILSSILSIIGLVTAFSNLAGGLIASKPLILNLGVMKEIRPQAESIYATLDKFRIVIGLFCLASGLLSLVSSILSFSFSIMGLMNQLVSIALGLLLSYAYLVSKKVPAPAGAEGQGDAKDKAGQAAAEAAQKAQEMFKKYEKKVRVLEMYATPIGITAIVLSIVGLVL